MKNLDILKEKLHNASAVIIASHVDPDGDAVGSVLGFYHALKHLPCQIIPFLKHPVPDRYCFLPGASDILSELPSIKDKSNVILLAPDIPRIDRIGLDESVWNDLNAYIVNIDHHESNHDYGDLKFVLCELSSSTHIIFEMLSQMNFEINPDCATALFNGLITDTGSFHYENTKPDSLELGAALMKMGADHETIIKEVFTNFPREKLVLEKLVLKTLQFHENLAWVHCSLDMIEESGYSDTEEIINKIIATKDIDVAVFFKEIRQDFTKISFRASEHADVNKIAAMFGGGGHSRASGARMEQSLQITMDTVISRIKQHLKKG